MSYVFALLACLVYFAATFLLLLKAKWKMAAYYTPLPSVKLLITAFVLLALYYVVLLLRSHFLVLTQCSREEWLLRLMLNIFPVYCMVYAPLPAFAYKKRVKSSMLVIVAFCMAVVLLGSYAGGTLDSWSSLYQKVLSGCCLSVLACGVIPLGVVYKSNELSKKLYHNKAGIFRRLFLIYWAVTSFAYVMVLLGWTVPVRVYCVLTVFAHLLLLLPVLASTPEEKAHVPAKVYPQAGLLPHSSWAVLEEASRAVEKSDDMAYNRLEDYMKKEKPYLRPEISRSQVAAALGTNATYLSRLINSRENTSFVQYVNKHRVYYAQEYYQKHSNISLMDLCVESGFRSMAAFNIAFRSYLGITPGQWCRQMANQ